MNLDFMELSNLKKTHGYKILENEWMHQSVELEKRIQKAAQGGKESAWRYWAGQLAGFKLAVTALDRALDAMIAEAESKEPNIVDKLLEEMKPS